MNIQLGIRRNSLKYNQLVHYSKWEFYLLDKSFHRLRFYSQLRKLRTTPHKRYVAPLSTTRSIPLTKDNHLQLVIPSKHTSTGNGMKNVSTRTPNLEDLAPSFLRICKNVIQWALVLHCFIGGHHHSSTNGVNSIGCKPSTLVMTQPRAKLAKKLSCKPHQRTEHVRLKINSNAAKDVCYDGKELHKDIAPLFIYFPTSSHEKKTSYYSNHWTVPRYVPGLLISG